MHGIRAGGRARWRCATALLAAFVLAVAGAASASASWRIEAGASTPARGDPPLPGRARERGRSCPPRPGGRDDGRALERHEVVGGAEPQPRNHQQRAARSVVRVAVGECGGRCFLPTGPALGCRLRIVDVVYRGRGDETGALVERWGGRTWTMVAHPSAHEQSAVFGGLSCASRAACVAVSTGPAGALIESSNRHGWSRSEHLGPDLGNVSCPTTTVCKAVGVGITVETSG